MIQVNGQANIWKNEIFSTGLEEYNYLYKLELKHALFESKNRNDHAHCELCWNKISGNETDIHDMLMQIAYIGYALIAIKISKTYFIGRYQILT